MRYRRQVNTVIKVKCIRDDTHYLKNTFIQMCIAFVFLREEWSEPESGPMPGVNYVTFGGTVSILLKHRLKNRPGRAGHLVPNAEFYGFVNPWFYRELMLHTSMK